MRTADIDWQVLRGVSLVWAATLVLCACLVGASHYFFNRMERAYFNQKDQLVTIRAKYRALDDSRRVMERYLPKFRRFEERGIVGPERRLDWIETVRRAAEQTRLPSFRYQITAQAPHDLHSVSPTGVYRAYASEMQVELGLLHEGDLLSLLADLETRTTGLFRVGECRIKRARATLGRDPTRSNLSATCGIDWLTIRQHSEAAT